MKNKICLWIFLLLLFVEAVSANPFPGVSTGRDLIKAANQQGYSLQFRHFQARSLSDFDQVRNIHVRGRTIYADWVNAFEMPDHTRQSVDRVKAAVANTTVKLEIETLVTKNPAQYGLVYSQNIQPGGLVMASRPAFIEKNQNSTSFSKPVLNNGSGTRRAGGANAVRLPYHNADGDVVIRLKVFGMQPAEMIDLSGLTFEQAKSRLAEIGIPVGYIQDTYEKAYQENLYGKIFKQSIAPGTLLTEPRMMGVMIYAFPKTVMPDLTKGWTLEKVKQEKYLRVLTRFIDTAEPSQDGMIASQSIKPGTALERKEYITVEVYRFKDPFDRFDYIKVHEEEAVQKLTEKNLQYRIEEKDIFEHFHSTMDEEFIRENDGLVVEALRKDGVIVLTVIRFTPQTDSLPDLKGMDSQEGIKALIQLQKKMPGLEYMIEYETVNLVKDDGKVIRTEPPAFSEIKSYDSVTLYCGKVKVSSIDDLKAKVPDLRGLMPDEAKRELEALGFTKFSIIKEKKVGAVDGTVVDILSQIGISAIGYKNFVQERLTLCVADIDAIEMPVMEHYIGLPPEQAKKFLLQLGFRHIDFQSETDAFVNYSLIKQPPGRVIATLPRYGVKLDSGLDAHITLIVRLDQGQTLPENVRLNPPQKSETVRVPGLRTTVEETIRVLKENDLVPQVQYEITKFPHFKGKLKPGSNPPYNTIVKRGSTVSFTVYTLKALVPGLRAYDEQKAVRYLERRGLKADITYVETDVKSNHGRVASQDPAKGSLVEPESSVKLVVSKYSGMIVMPNLLFKTYDSDIGSFLSKYFGLTYRVIENLTNFEEDDGRIIKTVPAGGERVKEGTEVEVHVYRLSETAGRLLPNVKLRSGEWARRILEEKGFVVKVFDVPSDSVVLNGYVDSQSPAAGSRLAKGEVVTLGILRHTGKIILQNFIDQEVGSSVQAYFSSAGLNYEIINDEKTVVDKRLEGRIYRTEPASGSKVSRGDTVKIFVYGMDASSDAEEAGEDSEAVRQIRSFYTRFKEAYESKDETQVIELISDQWSSKDGNSITELEENLYNIFNVFDDIQYELSELIIRKELIGYYKVYYNLTIRGTIYETGLNHIETSSVRELVKVMDGSVRIMKTYNGSFWSVNR